MKKDILCLDGYVSRIRRGLGEIEVSISEAFVSKNKVKKGRAVRLDGWCYEVASVGALSDSWPGDILLFLRPEFGEIPSVWDKTAASMGQSEKEHEIEIAAIERYCPKDGDVLLVTLSKNDLPPSAWLEHASIIKGRLEKGLRDRGHDVTVWVFEHGVKLRVISKPDGGCEDGVGEDGCR